MSTDSPPRQLAGDGHEVWISSSPELSSPPKSESEPSISPPTYQLGNHSASSHGGSTDLASRGVEDSAGAPPSIAAHSTKSAAPAKNTAPGSVKKTARRKDKTANGHSGTSTATDERVKVKKPRSSTNPTVPRKKQKTLDSSIEATQAQLPSRQARVSSLVGFDDRENAAHATNLSGGGPSAQNGSREAIQKPDSSMVGPGQPAQARTSGQNYDPIRSANIDSTPATFFGGAPPFSPTQKSANCASASPSISSLIDPPTSTAATHQLSFSQANRLQSSNGRTSIPSSPSTIEVAQPVPTVMVDRKRLLGAAETDEDTRMCSPPPPAVVNTTNKKGAAGTSTNASSAAPSPKPARQKAAPPPLPQGNGLLSTALFGGPTSAPSQSSTENRTPTIILEIPMNGETNKTINFARMAEERYGFNALYPRIAAQRERLARVAAAGAALGPDSGAGSGDEMSVDLSDPESNVEAPGAGAPSDGGEVKKKRQTKTEDYDKDDPFVDDSEMLWEEQAAASKDGFFVYSGPLVPAGEKPSIERAGGTVKRGRGRGRGGSTRGGGSGRGGATPSSGPGSRGGGTVRKPRITKADRLKREQEKQEREKMATLAAKPTTYVG